MSSHHPQAAAPLAVVGIGNMGLPMVRRLVNAGYVVRVHDLRDSAMRAAQAVGAQATADAASAGDGVSMAIVVVVDAAQCHEVMFGAAGLCLAASLPQAVMICSTIAPDDVERFATRLGSLGIACLDAPMSGGPQRAGDGTMSLMVACRDLQYQQYEPVLAVLSARCFRVGTQPGQGARTKLVNNLLAAINLAGAAEAMALAIRIGLDPAMTLSVIEQSSGASWIGSERLHRVLAGDSMPRAHMSLLAKDAALALQLDVARSAMGCETPLPLGRAAAAVFEAACKQGWRDADDGALLNWTLGQWKPREIEP